MSIIVIIRYSFSKINPARYGQSQWARVFKAFIGLQAISMGLLVLPKRSRSLISSQYFLLLVSEDLLDQPGISPRQLVRFYKPLLHNSWHHPYRLHCFPIVSTRKSRGYRISSLGRQSRLHRGVSRSRSTKTGWSCNLTSEWAPTTEESGYAELYTVISQCWLRPRPAFHTIGKARHGRSCGYLSLLWCVRLIVEFLFGWHVASFRDYFFSQASLLGT